MRQVGTAQPFIHSGLAEFNEPTPKVAQLAAFSAAALDEGASPTLPQDGAFRPFDRTHLDQALAISESRKLAAARDERRRRVAKMSRWLGEAVPAELIHVGAGQNQSAVIRSTIAPAAAAYQSESSHDSAEIRSSHRNVPSSASICNVSSAGHGNVSHEGSVASNLQSFMSIDSSDDEEEPVAKAATHRSSAAPSVRSTASASAAASTHAILPAAAAAAADGISAYRNSIDSYEYLLENDRERLGELASIFNAARIAPSDAPKRPTTMVRPSRSPARPRTCGDARGAPPQPLALSANTSAQRRQTLSASVGGMPRRSAAFLELSDSESDSSDAEDHHDATRTSSSYYSSSHYPASHNNAAKRYPNNDRSISKLSNFFGSTPSQIVRSQSDILRSSSNGDASFDSVRGGISQPDALRTILRSLEEEALDDSKLNSFQKSEISRKVRGLKKRTTKMFA